MFQFLNDVFLKDPAIAQALESLKFGVLFELLVQSSPVKTYKPSRAALLSCNLSLAHARVTSIKTMAYNVKLNSTNIIFRSACSYRHLTCPCNLHKLTIPNDLANRMKVSSIVLSTALSASGTSDRATAISPLDSNSLVHLFKVSEKNLHPHKIP